ncbi:PIN domain-containing protein [Virgibacillus dakarensis]|nr:PIN domain-containing protein [Virgibacillus dakarensis]
MRYLLNDAEDMREKAAEILVNSDIYVPNEVIAEIGYMLEKVYKVENSELSSSLSELFGYDNLIVDDIKIVSEALRLYVERRLDFVDTLLYAYHKIGNHEVFTFDKKLNRLLLN